MFIDNFPKYESLISQEKKINAGHFNIYVLYVANHLTGKTKHIPYICNMHILYIPIYNTKTKFEFNFQILGGIKV